MALGKRLINTGAAAAACFTEDVNPFTGTSADGGVALWSLDYDGTETSGSHDMIPEPEPIFGVGGKINTGVRFSENTNGLRNTSLQLNSTAHSVSLWMRPKDITAARNQTVFFSAFNGHPYFILGKRFDQSTSFHYRNETGSELYFTLSNADIWYHVVVTRTNGSCKIYVNGSFVTSNTDAMGTYGSSSYQYTAIGALPHSSYPGEYFDGDVDQVRVFNRVLDETTSGEISALYAETACVHTATANTADFPSNATAVAHYPLDNSSEDNKGTNDGTDTNIEYTFGRFGQAAVFNGSSSKIEINSNLNIANNSFSFSFWIACTDSTTANYVIITEGNNGNNKNLHIGRLSSSYHTNSNKLRFSFYANDVDSTTNVSTDGTWQHWVCTFEESTKVQKIYLNGVLENTKEATSNFLGTTDLQIGGLTDWGSNNGFNGSIDQVRIFSNALSDIQVESLYNEKPEVDTSNFKAVLYEGTGATQYISNVGMDLETSGGLIWIKNRDQADNHTLVDSVRGISTSGTKYIASNETDAEDTSTNMPVSLEKNGFFVQGVAGITNTSGEDYVSWVFKGGGEAVNIGVNSITGSTPSIASDVSANTAAGFSIVKWTGNNLASQTIGHGLDNPPEITIIKKLTGTTLDWQINLNSSITGTEGYFNFNTAALYTTFPNYYTSANSTVISTNGTTTTERQYNNQSADYIAYCWHSVTGYSKIGSYSGNSNTRTIVTGFKPSFVMIKTTNTVSNWVIFDDKRLGEYIMPSLPNQGYPSTDMVTSFVSNGFTLGADVSTAAVNASNVNYIYMAFK